MVFLIFLLFVLSCNSLQREKPNEEINSKELLRLRGCTHCHDVKRPLAGPSFLEISNRYKDDKDTEKLLKSLLSGSCGKWKARMECMPPQRIDRTEAERMIKWILHLKTENPPVPSS